MSLKSKAKSFYVTVILTLTGTTLAALYDGGYNIASGAIGSLAFASVITSLLPFFVSMYLFKEHEYHNGQKKYLKVWGLVIYFFCFPVKGFIIYSNLALLINGGAGWAFG